MTVKPGQVVKHYLATPSQRLKEILFKLKAAKLFLPVAVRGLINPGFAAHIFDGASGFDGLQNGNDLVFGESGFAHGDLLQEHNQYAGRSLKVNGPFCRDAYTGAPHCP